jgi:hypothetical protein
MNDLKICPFMSRYGKMVYCQAENCALWVADINSVENGQFVCSLTHIAALAHELKHGK